MVVETSILLLILLAGAADRVRGDTFGWNRVLEKLMYGWIITAIICLSWNMIWTPVLAVLFALGSAFGWGMPFGWYLYGYDEAHHHKENKEWWQFGSLWKMPFTSLVVRGILWGLPLLAVAYWTPAAYVIAGSIAIAFPLSVFIIKHTIKSEKKWEYTETLRGILCGGLVALGRLFL